MEETQGAPAPEGVTEQTETPTSTEATPAPESGGVDQALSPAQARIQKLANENREFRTQLQKLQQETQSYAGAKALHERLTKNPQQLRAVMDLLEGRNQQTQDPFEGYQPHEAEALRAAMEFRQWKAEQERVAQENYTRSIEENRLNLETAFEEKLKADGFIGKDGSYDELEVDLLSDAVLSRATRIAQDPNRITEKELMKAYDYVQQGTKSLEKRLLKNQVKTTPPPPSTPNKGTPPKPGKETEDQRISRMAQEYAAARG